MMSAFFQLCVFELTLAAILSQVLRAHHRLLTVYPAEMKSCSLRYVLLLMLP